MAELVPYPFAPLVARMFEELERNGTIFDLSERKFVSGSEELDVSVSFHGQRAGCPLGPAAGPQTQMAQNIVLSYLGGSRIQELKTVQINDALTIPRPCIDMRNVGYNAEWSQELKIEESLDEYVKASMLIRMLGESEILDLAPGFGDVIYDMSVGYDLAGIQSEKVARFIGGMLDATPVIDRFRSQIPDKYKQYRNLDYEPQLSRTITLSTFHGCPPDEIERIIDHLMHEWNVDCIVKFNPMLLGNEIARSLLHEDMGYDDIRVPDSAFERDTSWPQAVEIVERLSETADSLGLGFGVKFSNTLIVENTAGFLPDSEKEVYLSGAPLHVLAMNLVKKFRDHFEDRFPISFSAGIDAKNYPDAVAIGLVPVTVCSDLLKPGGYGRLTNYHKFLEQRMRDVGATDVDTFIIKAYGIGVAALDALLSPDDPHRSSCQAALTENVDLRKAAGEELFARWVSEAKLLNTDHYVRDLSTDPRYSRAQNAKMPPSIDSSLELFDCITCDKCIPVCPNDANFSFETGTETIPSMILSGTSDTPDLRRSDNIALEHDRQIGTFADFCNECGNCDVFCPEEGGPYQFKPLFFGSEKEWTSSPGHDGFYIERKKGYDLVLGRVRTGEYRLEATETKAVYSGQGFRLELDLAEPESVKGDWENDVDLTWCYIMNLLRRSILDAEKINYINALS